MRMTCMQAIFSSEMLYLSFHSVPFVFHCGYDVMFIDVFFKKLEFSHDLTVF